MRRISDFEPAWWLNNRHLQTIVPNTFRPQPKLTVRRERVELPDGDFVDADWTTGTQGPIVVLLHGLEGSIKSRYAGWMLKRLHDAGYRGVVLHFRGCSGELNRKAQGYHSGHTADFNFFIHELKQREPSTPLAALGYSLGGNALLKWLGDNPDQTLIETGVAVSVPFDLKACSTTVNIGFAKIYQYHLLKRMLQTAKHKQALIHAAGLNPDLASLRSFHDFDDALTAPLHGFTDAEHYYRECSSRPRMRNIRTPTLVLHAEDDPFMTPDTPPSSEELSPAVTLELSPNGGHVGFVSGRWPWKPEYWLETRIMAHFEEHFAAATQTVPEFEKLTANIS